MNRRLTALVAGLALAAASPGFAQDTGTLKKIKDTGTVAVGYRDASLPFSYLDDKQQPVGYSMELCMKIVEALKQKLNLPNLKVDLVAVTSQTRIPLIANGTTDMECGSTTNSKERQKQAAFLYTTFVMGTKLLVKKSSNIHSYKDLKGKPVAVTAGSPQTGMPRSTRPFWGVGLPALSKMCQANDPPRSQPVPGRLAGHRVLARRAARSSRSACGTLIRNSWISCVAGLVIAVASSSR